MTTTIRVENLQMIPLRPLSELNIKNGDVLYIGDKFNVGEEIADEVGWVVVDSDDLGVFEHADAKEYRFVDDWDYDRTMARKLQPGERLIITHEG